MKIAPHHSNVANRMVCHCRQIFLEKKRLQLSWSTSASLVQLFDERQLCRILIIGYAFADCLRYQIILIKRISISVFCHVEDRVQPIFDTRDTEEEFSGSVFIEARVRACHGKDNDYKGEQMAKTAQVTGRSAQSDRYEETYC